jgi:hypothetical protein
MYKVLDACIRVICMIHSTTSITYDHRDGYKPFKQQTHILLPADECLETLPGALHLLIKAKRESMKM